MPSGVLRLGDPGLQHHHQHGAADAQRAAVLRPVRARGHRRAHPRQDRRLQEEGHVDGRQCAARLQRAPTERGRRPRRRSPEAESYAPSSPVPGTRLQNEVRTARWAGQRTRVATSRRGKPRRVPRTRALNHLLKNRHYLSARSSLRSFASGAHPRSSSGTVRSVQQRMQPTLMPGASGLCAPAAPPQRSSGSMPRANR